MNLCSDNLYEILQYDNTLYHKLILVCKYINDLINNIHYFKYKRIRYGLRVGNEKYTFVLRYGIISDKRYYNTLYYILRKINLYHSKDIQYFDYTLIVINSKPRSDIMDEEFSKIHSVLNNKLFLYNDICFKKIDDASNIADCIRYKFYAKMKILKIKKTFIDQIKENIDNKFVISNIYYSITSLNYFLYADDVSKEEINEYNQNTIECYRKIIKDNTIIID